MEFSRPEYWSGCLFLLQGIFPTQGSCAGLCTSHRGRHQYPHFTDLETEAQSSKGTRPLSLLQRGLAPRSKGKARAELRPARRQSRCDPMGCSPPGSSVHGILQARILEWVAISFSTGSPRPNPWNVLPASQSQSHYEGHRLERALCG